MTNEVFRCHYSQAHGVMWPGLSDQLFVILLVAQLLLIGARPRLRVTRPTTRPPVHPSNRPTVHPSTHPPVHPSTRPRRTPVHRFQVHLVNESPTALALAPLPFITLAQVTWPFLETSYTLP